LHCQLIKGVKYQVSFYVSLAEISNIYTNSIGAAFVDDLDYTSNLTSNLVYYTFIDGGNFVIPGAYISDKTTWTNVIGTFIANGTETHIVIGDFGTTSSHDPGVTPAPNSLAYYFLDDISVTPVNTLTVSAPSICSGFTAGLTNNLDNQLPLSWSPGTGLSCNNCGTPTTPALTSNTNYSATLTYCTGCSYTASTTVIVNPKPTVIVPSNSVYCKNDIVPLTSFISNPLGATYTWTNSNTSIGLAASGIGSVPQFTATNGTSSPITGTITVTPTKNGCVGTPSSYTITVNPIPNVTVPASFSVCPNASVSATNFTSNVSGTTYTWTNSNTSIGLAASGTGNVPAFTTVNSGNTTLTATITVTGTAGGCMGTATTYTITVNPKPTVLVPSNSVYCPNDIVPLTSFISNPLGATYTWTNSNTAIGLAASGSGNIPAFTTTNSTGSPITASITVTPSLNGCTGTPSTFTITVNPVPIITASASPASVNLGSTSNLTSSAGVTYSWSPGSTLNSSTIQNPVATPNVTTTYTVTTANSYGCSSSATTTVTVIYPQCNLTINYDITANTTSSALFGTGTITVTNKNIHIADGVILTVDDFTTFSGCNFNMGAGAKINIASVDSKTCTFTNKTHLFACGNMWDGIYTTKGCTLNINGDCLIEDAQNAVVAELAGYFTINTAIFNRNYISVYVLADPSGTYGTIVNTIFTSRYIPSPGGLANVNNYTVATINSHPLAGFSAANMKAPNSQKNSPYAIYAIDIANFNIGSASAGANIFDNVGCGIYLDKTNATIYNNKFQNIVNAPSCIGCPPISGKAIYTSGTTTGVYTVTIGGASANQSNVFNDVFYSMHLTNYKTNNVLNNSISNTITLTGTYGTGQYGIVIQPAQNNTMDVENNTISNCANGIWFNRNNSSSISTLNLIADGNTISANSNGFCTTAINVTDLSAGTSVVPTISEIKNNVITETVTCISLSNVKKPLNIESNSVTVRYATTGARNGIKAVGCIGTSIINNHTKYNNIGGYAYTSTGNLSAYGIYLQNSTNMLVKCNQIDDAARSMVFQGTCTSSLTTNTSPTVGITQNTMHNAQDGLVLLGSGIIGVQGSTTVASNNYWDAASTFLRSQTYTDNTNGANTASKLFMNTGASTFPTLNGSSIADPYTSTGGTIGLNTSSGAPATCGSVPAITTFHSNYRSAIIDSAYLTELVAIVNDASILPMYNNESHWQRLDYVYSQIRNNPSLTSNNVLDSFYNANNSMAYGKFADVQDAILDNNYSGAASINNSVNASNVIEQNQQSINGFILDQLADTNYVYSTADINSLYTIAYQCPLSGGNAVYQARNLLMGITSNVIEFVDNCDELSSKIYVENKNEGTEKQNRMFNLNPNPNSGDMVLAYVLNSTDLAVLQLVDVTGKSVGRYELNGHNNSLHINNTKLNNGVYFYTITVNNKIVQQDKLIIIK
jgi:hypothetical protein